ncbi:MULTISPECIES: hypothetical protein [unclassified Mesorhizobium]|uniref:hypothetical protein n=1 Tax=unclassified Mesorhizobium TaxID=325217 RepID=UPI000FCC1851|nr:MULTISPECIES: hypothetical protein [unclassified Mesorhizobium]RUX91136.1 hypothetical protein EN993_28145 [Mesorhizobium sp. M7D.F.Ca.US.004.01.2.1]RVA36922.1 hypothetical protein EN935_00980 [Mesorhizobium sp. M7D.F.Ca.US.004.03.1.1]
MRQDQKRPKLTVVVAFDRGEDGELFTAYGPTDQQSEDRAVRIAKALAGKHIGVIAWTRDADPALGDYGPPTVLFTNGDVADME